MGAVHVKMFVGKEQNTNNFVGGIYGVMSWTDAEEESVLITSEYRERFLQQNLLAAKYSVGVILPEKYEIEYELRRERCSF